MKRQVKFNKEALESVKVGLDIVANAVKHTIGPKGRNVFINREMFNEMTNDGVKIAHAITLKDPLQDMGAWLVKNTSAQTNEEAGDGTSTTAVLLQAIIEESLKRPENPMDIRYSLLKAGKKVEEEIKGLAREVKEDQIANVATISSESESIGSLVAEVINKVGRDIPVSIEDNKLPKIEYSIVEGLETKVGYANNAWVTDQERQVMEYADVQVLAIDKKINNIGELAEPLKKFAAAGINTFVLLVNDVDSIVVGQLVAAKQLGAWTVPVIIVRGSELEDMAAAAGATIITDSAGLKIKDIVVGHLGKVTKLIATDKKTTIISDPSEKKTNAILALNAKAENTKNQYEAEGYLRRAAALKGGVAVIKVGSHTDSERGYLKDKIEDAINATKSALDEGLVEGGGMCLYRVSNKIKGNSIGEEILRKALRAPLRAIIDNAGKDYTTIIKSLSSKKGYDAMKDKNVDMFKAGIIDPAKVTRCAFANALSTASTFITTAVAVANEIDDKK